MARKAAAGSGSIYKRTIERNGKEYTYWTGTISLGYNKGTGKRIRKTVTGKTQKEVADKVREITSAVAAKTYVEPSRMRLKDWMEQWVEEYCTDKKWTTVKTYRAAIRTHIIPQLGEARLDDLETVDVQQFYNRLQKSLAPKSIRNIHGVLTKALSDAVALGMIAKNPCDLCKLQQVPDPDINYMSDDQFAAYMQAADSDPLGIMLKVILLTGMRESEAIGLTWDDIDYRRGLIRIRKQLQRRPIDEGGWTRQTPKSGKGRELYVAPVVMELLRQQEELQQIDRVMAGDYWQGWQSDQERKRWECFLMPSGKHVSTTTIRYHHKKVAAAIGCPELRVHDLRHSYAVVSLENGDDIKTVQENLGHATASFTLDVYGHVSDRMKKQSADRLQQFVKSL